MGQISSGAFTFDQIGLKDLYISQGSVAIGPLACSNIGNGIDDFKAADHLAKDRLVLI